jgi:hypothetical protein
MNKFPWIAAALCILMLSGCASNTARVQPIVDSKQSPVSSSGYVAGMFSRDWGPGKLDFALGVVNSATAEEYVMPFVVGTSLPDSVKDRFGMIQLPPGKYRIAYWLSYSTKDNQQLTKTAISPDATAGLPFTVTSGEVVFLGSFVARNDNNQWSVHHQRIVLQSAQQALSKRYPTFSTQPFSCPSCLK